MELMTVWSLVLMVMSIDMQRVIPPNINLHPLWEGMEEGLKVGLLCILSGFYPDKLSVEWQVDGKAVTTSPVQQKLQSVEGKENTFSLSSQLELDQSQWTQGSEVTCKATHNAAQGPPPGAPVSRTTSICSAFPSSTPSIHLETPRFRTVMTQTEVTATCVVHSAYDAKVTWLLDGKDPTNGTAVNQARSTTESISGNLTLSSSQWKTLNTVTCRAEHRCFNSIEKTSNVIGPAVSSTPTVLIRRSLPDLLDGDSAVLECAITQLSSSDLYVTFQANGVDFPEKQYVELPASKDPHSITRRFSVPTSHWKKDNTFTCKVNQGYSNSWVSNSTGKLFGEPSMELLLVRSEETSGSGTQKLMCSGWGFNPQIKWLSGSEQRFAAANEIRMGEDGRVVVTSHIIVAQQEWNQGKDFTCEVIDQDLQKTVRKSTSLCTEPLTVTLNPPRVREVFLDNQAVLDCVITGTDQDTVSGTTITWQVNGQAKTSGIILKPFESKDNLNSRVSTLTIDQTEWTKVNKVQCSAMKRCEVTPVIQELSFTKGSEAPSVSVHILPEEDTREEETVTLVCLVVIPSLYDVYIMWQENSSQYQEGVTSPPQKTQKGDYSVTSVFTTTKDKWETNVLFTCAVKHAGSDNNTAPKERSVLKSMGNSCEDKLY